jgi:hypothetical protein
MPLTMHDTKPIGLCLATQELFDTRRYLLNFCDGLILRGDDPRLKRKLELVKRNLNTFRSRQKFLEGHKAVIASNIDKILGLADRYSKTNPEKVSGLKNEGKILIQKVLDADSFDKISQLEADFKKKITLPIYQMFTSDLRKSDIRMV